MQTEEVQYAVVFGNTPSKIKELAASGAYKHYTFSPKSSAQEETIVGKHSWNRINTQAHVETVRDYAKGGKCGNCFNGFSHHGMGIPIFVESVNGIYNIEMYTVPPAETYCSFECTYRVMLDQPPVSAYVYAEAERNLHALYACMYPTEQELQPRQPLGLPLTDDIKRCEHLMTFRRNLPLQIVQMGTVYTSQ